MAKHLILVAATLGLFGAATAQGPIGAGYSDPKPITVKQGEVIPALDFRYRVLKISVGAKEYVQQYDQRGMSLKPMFDSDQLVVVELEVANEGDAPKDPAQFALKLTDSGGGVSAVGTFDARLQSRVAVQGGIPDQRIVRAELAPKGKTKIAVVFSIPRAERPKALQLFVGQETIVQGAYVQYTGPLLATVELNKG